MRIRCKGQRMRSVMSNHSWQIRRLHQSDVPQLLELIGGVRQEFGLAARVTSVLEPNDYAILDIYRHLRSAYFVAMADNDVLGGAGIFPLASGDWGTCELQRMYLCPQYRGRGIGQGLLTACLDIARSLGFERCYAETVSEMSTAIAFYERNGFRRLSAPIGDTGHSHNDCWMMLSLGPATAFI
jgi:putative acetyltransferase